MLRDHLGPGRLTAWFQPVVATTTGAVHRFEALVRYERTDGTVVSPAHLLPALERCGESALLFPYMLRASLEACRDWQDAGVRAGVALNVTTEDLVGGQLAELVSQTLADSGLAASLLTLELSEQHLLEAGGAATDSLTQLRSRGVRIAIDDFGAGHSSLSRLADIAVNELKIDRSLVTSADGDPRRQIVLRSAVDLGHRLGLEVVAEGVEDDDLAGTVRAVGADSIQGYLFGKPMPLADLLERYTPDAEEVVAPGPAKLPGAVRKVMPRTTLLSGWSTSVGSGTLAFAVGYLVLYVAWLLIQPGGEALNVWLGNVAYVPINGAGIAFAVLAGRGSLPRPRQAWYLLALGLASYLIGDLLQWFYESVLHRAALPGPADVGYLLFYPLAMLGVLRFGRPLRDRAVRRALTIDVLTVTIGFGAVIVELVLVPAVAAGSGIGTKLLASAYPLGDLLLLFAAVNVLLRGVERAVRRPLYLLAGSAVCFAVTDSVYVNMTTYNGRSLINLGWIVALTGVMVAAAAGRSLPDVGMDYRDRPAGGVGSLSRLPYVAIAATFYLLVKSECRDATWGQVALWTMALATTVLVVLRQHVAARTHSDLVRAYDALSSCDELTGLSTRRHFLAEAERELALSLRASGSDAGTALVLLDIDHFTAINERYGQQAGDQVLTAVAEACRNQLRQGDLLGRFGGDEIIALLPNSSGEAAEAIARRIEEHLRGLCIDTATGPVVAGISAGVAFAPAGEGLAEALVRVTAALQAAKRAAGLPHLPQTEPAPTR